MEHLDKKIKQLDSELLLSGVYFLFLKGEIIYVGQSEKLLFRIASDEHREKKWDNIKYISSKTFYWMDDYYFRRYFEQRCIHKLKPKYNSKMDKDKYISLNNFLMRRHLFNQNGNYVDVISNNLGDFSKTNTYSSKKYCKDHRYKNYFNRYFLSFFSLDFK